MMNTDYQFGFTAGYAQARAEVKHGHWIALEDKSPWPAFHDNAVQCSVCEFKYMRLMPRNYCPNCGAKMDEREWEEPEINPCRGCEDYISKGSCISKGGCGAKMYEVEE